MGAGQVWRHCQRSLGLGHAAFKSGFIKEAEPLQDQLAQQLGPGAVKVLHLIRNVQ